MPITDVLENNKKWAAAKQKENPEYFTSLENQQSPDYLWIGCSDSRVPANTLLGLAPGQVFVQRNVGNLATHKDMNCMTCVEYAVTALKVKHIIVCGHYNCGAVKGALTMPGKTPGLVNMWISDIKDTRNKHSQELSKLEGAAQINRLVELNAIRQVFNVCSSPTVQAAWESGQSLSVHGCVYSLHDGSLKELTKPITGYNSLTTALDQCSDKGLEEDLSSQVKNTLIFEDAGKGTAAH